MVAADEVVDAQVVDVSIVSDALTGEILAEIGAVGADGLRQLIERDVVIQVNLRGHTLFFQLLFDIVEVNSDWRGCRLRCLWLGREFQATRAGGGPAAWRAACRRWW